MVLWARDCLDACYADDNSHWQAPEMMAHCLPRMELLNSWEAFVADTRLTTPLYWKSKQHQVKGWRDYLYSQVASSSGITILCLKYSRLK